MTDNKNGTIWGVNHWMTDRQVELLPAEAVKQSVETAIAAIRAKAEEQGIENPRINVMFTAECYVPEEDDSE